MDARAAESLLGVAEEASASSRGPDANAAVQQLEDEYDELVAAIQWFVDHERTDEALRVANALYRFWITKQRFEEGARWFDLVLGSPGGEPRLRGAAFINAGFMPFWLGHDETAAVLFGRGLEAGRQLLDLPMISQALGGLARAALRTDVPEGRRLAREALAVSDGAGDEPGRSNALHLLGVGAQIAGDLTEARAWMTQRLALVRSSGNEFLIASEASNLSMVERQLGNLDAAQSLVREALEISERIGDKFMKPFAISGLAAIATDRSEFERAATLVGAAEAMMEAQHMAWPPDERPHYERMLAVLPDAIGAAAFDRARAAGHSMASNEAVELALRKEATVSFELTSPAFEAGSAIPRKYTCDGADVSPALWWSGAPDGTTALALILDDPDARGFIHWVVLDMVGSHTGGLAEGVSSSPNAPNQGSNDFGRIGWGGPCPPSGTHRYRFTLYSLDSPLGLTGTPTAKDLKAAMEGHILGQAELAGTYTRDR